MLVCGILCLCTDFHIKSSYPYVPQEIKDNIHLSIIYLKSHFDIAWYISYSIEC